MLANEFLALHTRCCLRGSVIFSLQLLIYSARRIALYLASQFARLHLPSCSRATARRANAGALDCSAFMSFTHLPLFPFASFDRLPVNRESDDCASKNRFVIYSGSPWRPMATVCAPRSGSHASGHQRDEDVDLFSLSWYNKTEIAPYFHDSTSARSTPSTGRHKSGSAPAQKVKLVIEIVASSPATFQLKWLEVTKAFSGDALKNTECQLYKCPELNACISPDLWCDGVEHCPSGFDESSTHCSKFPLLWVLLAAAGACVCVTAAILAVRCTWSGRKKTAKKKDEHGIGIGSVLHHHSREKDVMDTPVQFESRERHPSFRSTYYQSAPTNAIYATGSVDDFLDSSDRSCDFDFRGSTRCFRTCDRRERRPPVDPDAVNETSASTYSTGTLTTGSSTLTRTTLVSPYGGYNATHTQYNPYERPSYVTYYHRNVF